MQFLRGCAVDSVMRNALLGGSLVDLLPFPKRLSSAVPYSQLVWVAGDAALGRFSASNWATEWYLVEDAMDPRRNQPGASADIDLRFGTTGRHEYHPDMGRSIAHIIDGGGIIPMYSRGHRRYMQRRGGVTHSEPGNGKWIPKKKMVAVGFYIRRGVTSVPIGRAGPIWIKSPSGRRRWASTERGSERDDMR